MTTHKDILGRPLAQDMLVAFAHRNDLHLGKVGKISNVMIRVHGLTYKCTDGKLVYPSQVCILDGPDAVMYLLRHSR